MRDSISADTGAWPKPSVLQWARVQAAYELWEVAESLSVSLETIHAWEEGISHPDIKTIRELSLLYDLPFSYFFLEFPPEETPLADYRGVPHERRTRLSREAQLALREFRRLARLARTLQEITGKAVSREIGEAYPNEDPEQVAKREMSRLGITHVLRETRPTKKEAYQNWRKAIEDLGVFVFSLRTPSIECRGAAIRERPDVTAIMVNHNEEPAGRSFTLFHEYWHLMAKRDRQLVVCDQFPENTEKFANRFAASILVPENEFLELLKEKELDSYKDRWPDTTLSDIAADFAVSRDVIAIRLENLELAPAGFYRKKREHWDKFLSTGGGFGSGGGGKREYAQEKLGTLFLDLTLRAVRNGFLHPVDAALYMGEVRGGKRKWVIKARDVENWIGIDEISS